MTCRDNPVVQSTVRATAFTPWGPGLRIRASAWPCCCGPATPARTRSPTIRRCWLRRSGRSRPGSGRRSSSASTAPARATSSSGTCCRCPPRGGFCCSPAGQDGQIEEDKHAAEITDLMSRAGNWPDELRWIVRRVKPSRRQMRNLTDYEKKTGWRYSITCTNIPGTGITGVPGSHHPQYIDAVHREHAVVETGAATAHTLPGWPR